MSAGESYMKTDEYDEYNYGEFGGKGGKHRTKAEAKIRTNLNDTCGHTRKIVTKFANSQRNKREKN